ncbi:MAG: response regulator [Candidatus Thorarchaeota archaeon]|nr:response regulator [Candidatus Thorarchaeota archaeon]
MATVMIVDDDIFLHKVLTRILALGGHNVVEQAYNGAEAIQKYVAMNQKPDIILMDHRMPIMKGTTATRELLQHDPSITILFISADNTVEKEAMESGAVGFLTKPIRSAGLFAAIEKYVNQ